MTTSHPTKSGYTRAPKRPVEKLTAATADRRRLYELAVQSPDAEMDFVDSVFRRRRARIAHHIREDFCGTAYSSCEWVRRRPENTAVGLDLHAPTLAWGERHNVSRLSPDAQSRIKLLQRDVQRPGRGAAAGFDCVLAMNFSYWIFKTPATMRAYFETVRKSLVRDGIFFMDTWGGFESMKEQREKRRIRAPRGQFFTYVWDQAHFDPITCDLNCNIDFEFDDGTKMLRAFSYQWRLWTIPQIRELLADAGFKRTTLYWEGDDERGSGNGEFRPREHGEADASFIAYITAEK